MFTLTKCLILISAAITASSFSLGDNDVVFHLFTRNNPSQSQVLYPTASSIMGSFLNPFVRTIYTIHTNGDTFNNFNAFIVSAHLEAEDVNVVAIDWRVGSTTYTEGLAQAKQCGQLVSQFISILFNNFGVSPTMVRIVGHGLGGHIAGIAARNVGNVSHVIALDPSLHGWTHHPDRLNPNDADVVEVLHTTSGLLGYDYPLGDIDFYANGGAYQPGCGIDVACSSIYSYAFYGESITAAVRGGQRFIGTACEDYDGAIVLGCSGARDAVFGGTEVKSGDSGIYIFRTNPVQPFAQD